MNTISTQAETSRERAREYNGRFGAHAPGASEADITAAPEDQQAPQRQNLGLARHPDARKVLTVDATAEDWHAERNKGIGSSEAAQAVGASNYGGPRSVYEKKTGQVAPFRGNNFTELGQVLEPYVRSRFERETGLATQRCGLLASKGRDHMRANVDSFVEDGGVLEIKTFGNFSAVAEDWKNEQVPNDAWWQLQHGMAVSGRTHGYGIGMNRDTGDTYTVEVDRDEEAIAELTEAVDAVWEAKQTGVPPEPKGADLPTVEYQNIQAPAGSTRTVSGAEADAARSALGDYTDITAEEKMLKDRKADAEARLRDALGDAETLTDDQGNTLVENKPQKRVTQSGLKKYDPDLAKAYTHTVTKEVNEVDAERLEADHPDAYQASLQRRFKPADL